jgi:hypothetical protein
MHMQAAETTQMQSFCPVESWGASGLDASESSYHLLTRTTKVKSAGGNSGSTTIELQVI